MNVRYAFLIFLMLNGLLSNGQEMNSMDSTGTPESSDPSVVSTFDFFSSEEPLQMTLSFDMKSFLKTKDEPQNVDAEISVATPDKGNLTQKIKIKARGHMRREYCTFPPIMLKFNDNPDEEEPLLSSGDYKLVTHCTQSASFDNYLLKEYLAYKLYNLITPYSYKTRLVIMNYNDSENPGITTTEYGIIIEPTDQLAQRNKASKVNFRGVDQRHMDDYAMARVALFNYMIGNTDWSIREQHNVKVLSSNDITVEKGIPVPFDFDYSGFVNTRYSAPNSSTPIKYVTDRYYQGICYSNDILAATIEEFEGLKEEFIKTIDDFELLTKGHKKQALTFINSFYNSYRSTNVLISDLNRTCKK